MSQDVPSPDHPHSTEVGAGAAAHLKLAPRSSRLLAAILDGLLYTALNVPLLYYLGFFDGFPDLEPISPAAELGVALLGIGIILLLNGHLLQSRGQTIGKLLVGVRITDPLGAPVSLGRIVGLRYMPLWAASFVPMVGQFAALIDAVFIFGQSRRCLHDLLADTIVVEVEPMSWF